MMVLAIWLRLSNLSTYPAVGDTYDEQYWTFFGASLIQTGVPQSWSYIPVYKNKVPVSIQGIYYVIVKPSLDHPPLFSLFPGMVQVLSGRSWYELPPMGQIRLSLLPLWIANTALIFFVGKRMVNQKFGFFCMLIYAVTPSIVFSNRLVVSENLLSVFGLAFLYLVTLPERSRLRNYLLILLPALTILTKIAGIFFVFGLLFDLIIRKDKGWMYAFMGLGTGVFLFFLYTLKYDFGLFLAVQSFQGKRYSTFIGLPLLMILSQKLVMGVFLDGMMMMAKLAAVFVCFLPQPQKWLRSLVIQIFFQLLFFVIAVGETVSFTLNNKGGTGYYGWYVYALFPLAVIAFAYVFQQLWRSTNRIGMAVVLFFLVIQFRFFLYSIGLFDTAIFRLPKGLVFLTGVTILGSLILPRKYWRLYILTFISLVLLASAYQSRFMGPAYAIMDTEYIKPLL